jgi:hypothetical protein
MVSVMAELVVEVGLGLGLEVHPVLETLMIMLEGEEGMLQDIERERERERL